jgi:cyclically-permuted mutarotase family protein
MKFIFFVFIFITLLTAELSAQSNASLSIQFSIATTLPSSNGVGVSIGFAGSVSGIYQNHLLLAGGANFPDAMPWQGGKKVYHSKIFVYAQEHGQLKLINQAYILPESIAYAAVCNTSEGVLYIGGENEAGISNKVWMLQWNHQKKQVIYNAYPPIPIALTNAAVTVLNSKVYLAGGETSVNTTKHFFVLDLNNLSKGWISLRDCPQRVSHSVLVGVDDLENPTVFLVGGRSKNSFGISSFYDRVYQYNIEQDTWKEKSGLPYALSAGTGVWYNQDQLILFGGDRGIVFNQTETYLASIAKEQNLVVRQDLINQKNLIQENHPGFSKEILLYQVKTNEWQQIGSIPFDMPVTTTAVKWNNAIFLPSGEIKAGVRSPYILKANILNNKK